MDVFVGYVEEPTANYLDSVIIVLPRGTCAELQHRQTRTKTQITFQ